MKFLYGPGFDVKNRIFTRYSLSKNDIRAFTTESICVKTLRFSSPAALKGTELSLGGLAQEEGPQQMGFQPMPASDPKTHGCTHLRKLKGRCTKGMRMLGVSSVFTEITSQVHSSQQQRVLKDSRL